MCSRAKSLTLLLAAVSVVSLSTDVFGQGVRRSGSRSRRVTVRRGGATTPKIVVHDHRGKTPSKTTTSGGVRVPPPRRRPPSGTTIHDHRTKPGKISPFRLTARYIGQHPSDRHNGWSDGLQGVAHDQNNWFFTQKGRLWKFPITHDLNKFINRIPRLHQPPPKLPAGVKTATIPKSLKRSKYNHFGDLVHYNGYLFIPLEAEKGSNNQKPLLAVFRASTLTYVGAARLPRQTKAGWVAINPSNGLLYSSNNNLSSVNKLIAYRIQFNALRKNKVVVSYQSMKTLYDESGRVITLKKYMQGGAFSDDGKHLFLVNGMASSKTHSRDGGIWVFDFRTGKKVLKSSTSGTFKYEYHPGFPKAEEPEGITYWNLDNRNAPKIKGNLHVILLNNDFSSSDEFWLKHYRVRSTTKSRK